MIVSPLFSVLVKTDPARPRPAPASLPQNPRTASFSSSFSVSSGSPHELFFDGTQPAAARRSQICRVKVRRDLKEERNAKDFHMLNNSVFYYTVSTSIQKLI
ncbi:hypothetical protein GOODEAATRI_024387 [Goodea atripinnis]|uniref:Uncharacterized protein n=1 Tax=Goodea atripinnis TaxID=208336 RepID=A0ABV0MUS5_9TELE